MVKCLGAFRVLLFYSSTSLQFPKFPKFEAQLSNGSVLDRVSVYENYEFYGQMARTFSGK